jgi:Protein of unknown function (DUF4232)
MTNPYDPDSDEREATDLGDTWDAPDPDVDRRLRELTGEVTPLSPPPRAFEQVWARGRRRRRRAAWTMAGAGTLAFAVAVGTGIGLGLGGARQPMPTAAGQHSTGTAVSPASPASPSGTPGVVGPATSSSTPSILGSPSTAESAQTGGGDDPRCHTTDLNPSVSIVPGSQGMGHEEMNLTLTNTSGHPCTVYGYPGMALEDAAMTRQTTDVVRTPASARLLTLADGASASTTIDFSPDIPDATEPQSGACEPESYNLEITPPDETTQLVAPIAGGPVPVCEHGTLDVYPFVAGRTGPNQ